MPEPASHRLIFFLGSDWFANNVVPNACWPSPVFFIKYWIISLLLSSSRSDFIICSHLTTTSSIISTRSCQMEWDVFPDKFPSFARSEEHTSELQSRENIV